MSIEDFVTYEQAVKLKRLGFKEECLYYYDEYDTIFANCDDGDVSVDDLYYSYNSKPSKLCDAPTLAQAQKWFREKKNLSIEPCFYRRDCKDDKHWFCGITDCASSTLWINPAF